MQSQFIMRTFSTVFLVFLQFVSYFRCNHAPSVIIVGAGPAGIAAATRLLINNITNIKILEAEGRIGGRIHSVKFGDATVDLGAQWCEGKSGNIVYETVKDLDLLEPTNSSHTFYHSSREYVDQNLSHELEKLLVDIYSEDIDTEGISSGHYIINRYNKTIQERYKNNPKKLKFASEFLSVLKTEFLLYEGTFSWFDSSAASDFRSSGGFQDLNWKGRGYKNFLDVLMKNYPDPRKKLPMDDKIILNKEVIKIVWDENDKTGATVECLDNSVYRADHVIVTTSLGVLKERYNDLFHPALPQEKINAIEELGIAAVTKAFFHFPQRWWPTDNFNSIALFWSEKDRLQLLQEFPESDKPVKIDHAWLTNLLGFDPTENNPNVLETWFGGEFVPEIELLSDERIVDGVMFILDKFVGDQFRNITKPDAVFRYNWYANPHFRGTYSYETVEARRRNISGAVALSKPLIASNGKQTLLFAGEATNPTHYATVHGAVETGFREADRIIDLYK